MFTDLVGSTALLERLGDEEGEEHRRRLFAEFRAAATSNGGEVVKILGDGLMLAFARSADALRCAAMMQHQAERADVSLWVGAHVGEVTRTAGDYFGAPVVVASRLCEKASGGQVLLSDLTRELVGTKGGFTFDGIGSMQLKGFEHPVAVSSVPGTDEARFGGGHEATPSSQGTRDEPRSHLGRPPRHLPASRLRTDGQARSTVCRSHRLLVRAERPG